MRIETMRKRKRWLKIETGIGVLGVLITLIVTVAGPTLHDLMTTEERIAQSNLKDERIELLEELLLASHRNNNALRAQLAENNLLRNKAYGQLDEIVGQRNEARQEQERLKSQFAKERTSLEEALAVAKERIQELNADLQLANNKLAQNKVLTSQYALASERDEALNKAKQAEDRIRELTLKLSQNGIWP